MVERTVVSENRLMRKMTIDEYLYELNNPDLALEPKPSKTNPNDP